jgi:peptidyl-prolyl cis-trans isomerase SurA
MRKVAQKLVPSFLLPILLFSTVAAQTLFTCGGQPISKEDFLKAYNKNNTAGRATTASYKDYLELYIRYKLKVRVAFDLHLDTLPGQRSELQNFRAQVMENYMRDEESMNRLVNEAFSRGQHDIHLAHIFIPIPKNATPADTLAAWQKAMSAWNDLKNKKGFAETALAWSGDPAVRTNKGDVGYITVFTLPYELENLAYSTPPGQFSKPYRSRAGYHIFKNMGERKSLGKIKVAQILLSVAPGASEESRKATELRADSIYESLLKGADFALLAKTFSGDNLSFQNGGEMPVFGVGRYDSAFETAAFSLTRNGEIGRPMYSSFGYHIIKRIARMPFPTELNKDTDPLIRQQVSGDYRMEVSRKALLARIYRQAGYKVSTGYSIADLWAFTDSASVNKGLSSYHDLNYQTILFSFAKQQYDLKQWLDFMQALRNPRNNLAGRMHQDLMDQFTRNMAMEYYRNHLEDFNKDFAFQLNEFREGNLLFEIMQRKIWDRASTDSAGLRNYYETHKDKYWWSASADAILFTCNNQKTADQLKTALSAAPSNWKKLVEGAGAGVQADSGRFELSQIPVPATSTNEKPSFTPGLITPLTPNVADNTVSFAYILNVYPERSPRNYKDARGFVINDYQVELEDRWIADLKKKYPVEVDEKVFASLPK